MKRRDFLKGGAAVTLPLMLNGLPLTAMAQNPLLQLLRQQTLNNGKVLVLIQMTGGNDGLNTLIPLDQYDKLLKARNNIAIPAARSLPLNGLTNTGLHPALTGLQSLYNSGQMNIVQAVSYPNQTFSHFRATDIWFTGSSAEQYLDTGWLGRSLESTYPGYPAGYPTADMPDPLAIQIGSQASTITQCSSINTAVTVTNPEKFYDLVNGTAGITPATPYGHELTFLRLITQQTNAYTTVITKAFNATSNATTYNDNNALASQLKIVARLIRGGLKTPVYIVSHPDSFDTHAKQVELGDVTTGAHANMLAVLSEAVQSFQNDLTAMGIADRVAAMTCTEFGRRIKSNDSMGSDHGAAVPVFFFGGALNPTIIGSNPIIPDNVLPTDQVNMQYDFRSVYYTVLKDWFALTDDQLTAVLPGPYTTLPIFRQTALPVHLLSFTGNWLTNQVSLRWETDQESGIDRYDVERSEDGISFAKIGSVSAINTSIRYTYNFNDTSLNKTFYYYRIKIIEKSGSNSYSAVLLLKTSQSSGNRIRIYPNPVTDKFTVAFDNRFTGALTVRITDLSGKEIWKDERQVTDSFNLNFSFANRKPVPGIYLLKLYAKNQEMAAKLMVQ